MTSQEIVKALRKTKGNVREAAPLCSMKPQGLYYHINTNPDVKAKLDEIRAKAKKPIPDVLAKLTVGEDEIGLVKLTGDMSHRTAARRVLTAKLAEATGRSAREVSEAVRANKRLTKLFESRLPEEPRETKDRETIGVTLTPEQSAWAKAQPRGTVAQLLLGLAGEAAPVIGEFAGAKQQTSFSLPLPAVAWLRKAAQERATTAQSVLRQVIENARLGASPTTAQA